MIDVSMVSAWREFWSATKVTGHILQSCENYCTVLTDTLQFSLINMHGWRTTQGHIYYLLSLELWMIMIKYEIRLGTGIVVEMEIKRIWMYACDILLWYKVSGQPVAYFNSNIPAVSLGFQNTNVDRT